MNKLDLIQSMNTWTVNKGYSSIFQQQLLTAGVGGPPLHAAVPTLAEVAEVGVDGELGGADAAPQHVGKTRE